MFFSLFIFFYACHTHAHARAHTHTYMHKISTNILLVFLLNYGNRYTYCIQLQILHIWGPFIIHFAYIHTYMHVYVHLYMNVHMYIHIRAWSWNRFTYCIWLSILHKLGACSFYIPTLCWINQLHCFCYSCLCLFGTYVLACWNIFF